MQRVCFDAEPTETDLRTLGSKERWLVYRELVRHRLRHVVGVALPRTKETMGGQAFGEAIDEWLSMGGPATRFFRHVPRDFFEHAVLEFEKASPAWLADLARYEISRWDVRYARPAPIDVGEFAFDRVPVMNPAAAVVDLSFPVHRTPMPTDGYSAERTILCMYRSKAHQPEPWVLNPLAADLTRAWQRANKTVAESIHEVAAAHQTDIGPGFIDKLSTMIADYLDRGILLGGQAPPP